MGETVYLTAGRRSPIAEAHDGGAEKTAYERARDARVALLAQKMKPLEVATKDL